MLGHVLVLYLPRCCSPGSIDMKRNIYGPSDSLWCIVWSYTLCSICARVGEEEGEGEEEERKVFGRALLYLVYRSPFLIVAIPT